MNEIQSYFICRDAINCVSTDFDSGANSDPNSDAINCVSTTN